MPNSPSAKKSMRKAAVRRERNRSYRSALRTVLKRCRAAAAGNDPAAAEAAFRLAVKKLDQAAAQHLIHKNLAARTKSRLSRLLKKPAATLTDHPVLARPTRLDATIYPAGVCGLCEASSAGEEPEPLRNQFSISASSAGAAGSLTRRKRRIWNHVPETMSSTSGSPTA